MDKPARSPGTALTNHRPIQPQPTSPARTLVVPERPKLAPGVRLAGQMQESAFQDPPWLLEREGAGYVQVTRLLYRIAEHCTGENTITDIAAKISASGQPVSASTVQRLLAQLLIPRGLVATADGSVVPVERRASPLALNMRMKMISPGIIEPVTRVLQGLFWPPVLIAVLAVAAIAHGWLFLVHGVAGSVRDILYAPGFIFLMLGAIILSAAFHEFGHASGLRKGGGRVKAMGAGFYLFFPAFYTDVSDNYRLRRWPRLRTDLGGFYFNLIFASGVMALYTATGSEFLLFIVVLLAFETLYQLLPFVRLDGYWALADLTGIPDFFSQMGAFWRRFLRLPGWREKALPELKWWGKAVFVLYTLITVPLLALLLFLLVKGLPRVLATGWDSFLQQTGVFAQAQISSDFLGMSSSAVQMLILTVMTVGPAFVLANLGRRGLVRLWRWSRPTPSRRAIGALSSIAAVALLWFLWAPQLPTFVGGKPALTGGRPGVLYHQTRFEPIAPDERGTLGAAFAGIIKLPSDNTPSPDGTNPVPSPGVATPTPTPTPEPATPTPGPGTEPTPTPNPDPTPTPSPTATPDGATPTPTLEPTSTPTPTPVLTPTPVPE